MKSRFSKPLSALIFLVLVVSNPSSAMDAAARALSQWALSVAPALLPFLIAVPALTTPEVCCLLSRLTGGLISLYRLPKNSAGTLFIGLLSGSPSGASALARIPRDPSDPPGAYLRAAIMSSGASPAFLLTGVAVSMLSAPETGRILLLSQLLSALLTGLLLLPVGQFRPFIVRESALRTEGAILSAMLTLLSIGGNMVLFSVLARLLSCLAPSLETPLLALFELAGGCRALSSLAVPLHLRLPLISAAACFGGISVCCQCMPFLTTVGVGWFEYVGGKIVQAALAALITCLQLELPAFGMTPSFFCLLLLFLLLFSVCLYTLFRRKFQKQSIAESSRQNAA